jgi:bacterial/archaeal transporter family-2 protein
MQIILIAVSIGVGMTSSLQIAMLGAINRDRGSLEASWISMLASVGGMALLLFAAAAAGARPRLPQSVAGPWLFAGMATVLLGTLVLAGRGLPLYLLATGLLPIPYLLAAASIAPRIGLGVYLAAIIAGQLIGAVALEHTGAFNTTPRPLDLLRLIGIIVLLLGVALMRGR